MYYVYIHTLPNGKIYVGSAKDIVGRWSNGEGYSKNKKFYGDIMLYGWNNIKHEIIAEFQDREPALMLESVLIALLNAENPNYGYNQTAIYEDAMRQYNERKPVEGVSFEKAYTEDTFFESTNMPRSVCEEMINQWIFNETHRQILKSRLLDAVSYPELAKMYGKSERQLKNIVHDGCAKLEKRF